MSLRFFCVLTVLTLFLDNTCHEINVGFVYIGSPKVLLAAFLLSLVLFAILQGYYN